MRALTMAAGRAWQNVRDYLVHPRRCSERRSARSAHRDGQPHAAMELQRPGHERDPVLRGQRSIRGVPCGADVASLRRSGTRLEIGPRPGRSMRSKGSSSSQGFHSFRRERTPQLVAVLDMTDGPRASGPRKLCHGSATFLSILMDAIPDYIYFKDMQSRFILTNKAHARAFGLARPRGGRRQDGFRFQHARERPGIL